MTFLAKLGSFLAQGIAIATGIWPLVSGLFGSNTKVQQAGTTAINDLTSVGQVVVQVEALLQGPGKGSVKLQAAAPLVANIVKTSELVSGHKIANETLFIQGCTDLTSAVAEILNALDSGGIQSAGKPTPPIPPAQTAPVAAPPAA
jgi:hypothetical protein